MGAMGDILHALPAVTALRKAHPAWHIGWAVEPRWRALLTAEAGEAEGRRSVQRPLVDQIHFVPTKAWSKRPLTKVTWDGILATRRELRASDYDAVLDLQGSIRSAVLSRMTGCHRTIGDSQPWEGPARFLYTERIETIGAHVIEKAMELASDVAGDLLMPEQPWLPVDAGAEVWCDHIVPKSGGRPVVLLNPGAGWGAKCWPAERYGLVARELTKAGARVMVNAGPGEDALAARVVAYSGGMAETVVCTLPQLISLTRRIALMIGGDTGPLHLACALGKPVVGIYGPTDPHRNGPYGSEFRVLRSPVSVRDHSRKPDTEAGLLTIQPEAVLQAAWDVAVIADGARSEGLQ